jgi:hypothetical protein
MPSHNTILAGKEMRRVRTSPMAWWWDSLLRIMDDEPTEEESCVGRWILWPSVLYIYIYTYARGAKFADASCLWVIGHVENYVFALVICTCLSIVICLDNSMFDGRFFDRLHKLRYNKYSSLASILDMFIFPVFFAFFVSTYSFLFEKKRKIIGKRQSKWERAFLYWYLQYFVTLWTEPQLDSQRFLCLPLIFLCYYYVSARFRIVDFPSFCVFF